MAVLPATERTTQSPKHEPAARRSAAGHLERPAALLLRRG